VDFIEKTKALSIALERAAKDTDDTYGEMRAGIAAAQTFVKEILDLTRVTARPAPELISITCDSCVHWAPPQGSLACRPTSNMDGAIVCTRPIKAATGPDPEKAVTYDSEGNSSGLMARPDFGCVLWERKP